METTSTGRLPASTPPRVNREIAERTVAAIARVGRDRQAIDRRLGELAREWDIERATMLSASVDAFLTLGLGLWRGRRWLVGGLALLGVSTLAHVIVGQCPSLPLYRRFGLRTREEIDRERYALKALRGDFDDARALGPEALLARMRRD